MSETACVPQDGQQLVLFEVDRRDITVAFDGGEVVTDTGLLPIRQLDRRLGVLAEAARLPAGIGECRMRKLLVDELGLLQHQHIGRLRGQPVEHLRQPNGE